MNAITLLTASGARTLTQRQDILTKKYSIQRRIQIFLDIGYKNT